MEEQLIQLLQGSLLPQQTPRKHAEQQLASLWSHPDYAPGLISIASHDSVPDDLRQAALYSLRLFIVSCWGDHFDEFKGQLLPEDVKQRIREPLLTLAMQDRLPSKVKNASSMAVSKIAGADFPEQWPDLLPKLMHVISTGTDDQLHGALKVLFELVDEALGEAQFFQVAGELVKAVFNVFITEGRRPTLRALAIKVFAACIQTLEALMEEHKAEVKAFAEDVLRQWIPFFIQIMKSTLPPTPTEEEENDETPNAEAYKGSVALKFQVVKVFFPHHTCWITHLRYTGAYADTQRLPHHLLPAQH
jgi:hypothetical protein